MPLYLVYVIYHIGGGGGVPCPLLYAVVDPSCALSCQVVSISCLMFPSFEFLCRLRSSAPMSLRVWGRVGDSLDLEITQRAYLNRLIPVPSSHCWGWTLILCVGTLDPQMHRCVARTKLMAILLFTYPHVLD